MINSIKLLTILCLVILLVTPLQSLAKEVKNPIDPIVIDSNSLTDKPKEPIFDTEVSIKKLLNSQGVIPTTTNWLEVTLLCEKLYTQLKNRKFLCIYNYSKIINRYDETKKYCKYSIRKIEQQQKIDLGLEAKEEYYKECMIKYGFEDYKNWKSYKNPATKDYNKQKDKKRGN